MKFAHNITITVFCKERCEAQSINETLHFLIPLDFEKEKIKIEIQKADIIDQKTIDIYTVHLTKPSHTAKFLEHLKKSLGTQINILKQQLDSRLDQGCNFFIRLDKDALQKKIYAITDSGNCYHIRITIAAYPKDREAARKVALKMLN